MKNDEFGDRMKGYEFVGTSLLLNTSRIMYARIDGRAFHTFTRGTIKPSDPSISHAMVEATKHLVKETQARIGYTQSDEISLVWNSRAFFDGKLQKVCSVLAAMATAKFITELPPHLQSRLPHFDCRVLNLPDEDEAANMILWRAMDGKKNAILSLAQCHFSHKQMQGKGQSDLIAMLADKGIDMNTIDQQYRYGTFIQKRNITRKLTEDELQNMPEKIRSICHNTGVTRSHYEIMNMPPFNTVKNRVGVIFKGEEPVV